MMMTVRRWAIVLLVSGLASLWAGADETVSGPDRHQRKNLDS